MRVLQINTERTWRGGERQTLYTIMGLIDAGIEVGLLCREGFPMHKRAQKLSVKIHTVRSQAEAVRFLMSKKVRMYDIIHPQTGKGHSLAVIAKTVNRKPIIYTRRVNFKQNRIQARMKYAMTDKVIAISRAIKETLANGGVRNIDVISSSVYERELDTKRAEILVEKMGLKGKHIVATTGDLVPQKGPLLMVETIKCLADIRDDFVFLHFGNQQMGKDVVPKIEKYGLENVYRLMGHHDAVEDYFSIFDVFLITSIETEGLCSSVYDAFVYKVPLVSTLGGGLVDSAGDRGLSCAEYDPHCLAKNISVLLDDKEKRKNMTEKAYEWANENVTIKNVTDRYVEIYNGMMNSK